MDNRKETLRAHYEPRLAKYCEGHEILDWESHDSQWCRFRVFIESLELSGKSLLDVGCGVGDLYGLLIDDLGIDVKYTGVDILESMIGEARKRHPGGDFRCVDLLKSDLDGETFNVAYCSGIFNLRVDDSESFTRQVISRIASRSTDSVVFNMLDSESPDREERYSYFDPDEVVTWPEIARYDPKIIRGYLPNDFTVICTIPEASW